MIKTLPTIGAFFAIAVLVALPVFLFLMQGCQANKTPQTQIKVNCNSDVEGGEQGPQEAGSELQGTKLGVEVEREAPAPKEPRHPKEDQQGKR